MPISIKEAFREVDKAAYQLPQGYTQGGYRGVVLLENAIHMMPSEVTSRGEHAESDHAAVERMRCAIMKLDPKEGGVTTITCFDDRGMRWDAVLNPQGFGVVTWEHVK